MTLSTILHRITADPVGLVLTVLLVAVYLAVREWAVRRADDDQQGQSE